jgi:hypothetical protein
LRQAVREEVVEDSSVLVAEHGVLGSVLGDLRHVVGEDALEEALGVRAGRLDLAHVRDVEDARGCPDRLVLLTDPGVLDGHLPPCERDELRAGLHVAVVQGSPL